MLNRLKYKFVYIGSFLDFLLVVRIWCSSNTKYNYKKILDKIKFIMIIILVLKLLIMNYINTKNN